MNKFVFWSVLNQHINVALTEDLSTFARGDTFWQAMMNLSETLKDWIPSVNAEETAVGVRLRMYQETGINKVELFVEKDGDRYAVRCANSRSFIEAQSKQEALTKYIAARGKTSVINTGEVNDK